MSLSVVHAPHPLMFRSVMQVVGLPRCHSKGKPPLCEGVMYQRASPNELLNFNQSAQSGMAEKAFQTMAIGVTTYTPDTYSYLYQPGDVNTP